MSENNPNNPLHAGRVGPTLDLNAPTINIKEYTLEPITLTSKAMIDPSLPNVEWFIERTKERIMVQAKIRVWSQEVDVQSVTYPADWWQAVKERFAPPWFLKRWPVKTTVWKARVMDTFPSIAYDIKKSHRLRILVHKER